MNTDFWCSWCSDRANFCVLDWSRQYASFELSHNLFEQTFFLGKKNTKPNPLCVFFTSKKKFVRSGCVIGQMKRLVETSLGHKIQRDLTTRSTRNLCLTLQVLSAGPYGINALKDLMGKCTKGSKSKFQYEGVGIF